MPAASENQPNYHLSCQHNENKKALEIKESILDFKGVWYRSIITVLDFKSAVSRHWSGKVSSILMLSRNLLKKDSSGKYRLAGFVERSSNSYCAENCDLLNTLNVPLASSFHGLSALKYFIPYIQISIQTLFPALSHEKRKHYLMLHSISLRALHALVVYYLDIPLCITVWDQKA